MHQDKRKRFYFIAAWIITGIVFIYAAFFTYKNGFTKLSFALEDGDVYDAGSGFQTEIQKDNGCELGQFVFLEHYDINYLRIVVDEEESQKAKLGFTGTATDDWTNVITIETMLHSGVNDIKLDRKDFQWAYYSIDGYTREKIKRIQYRESIEKESIPEAIAIIIASTACYILLSLIGGVFYSKLIKRKTINAVRYETRR